MVVTSTSMSLPQTGAPCTFLQQAYPKLQIAGGQNVHINLQLPNSCNRQCCCCCRHNDHHTQYQIPPTTPCCFYHMIKESNRRQPGRLPYPSFPPPPCCFSPCLTKRQRKMLEAFRPRIERLESSERSPMSSPLPEIDRSMRKSTGKGDQREKGWNQMTHIVPQKSEIPGHQSVAKDQLYRALDRTERREQYRLVSEKQKPVSEQPSHQFFPAFSREQRSQELHVVEPASQETPLGKATMNNQPSNTLPCPSAQVSELPFSTLQRTLNQTVHQPEIEAQSLPTRISTSPIVQEAGYKSYTLNAKLAREESPSTDENSFMEKGLTREKSEDSPEMELKDREQVIQKKATLIDRSLQRKGGVESAENQQLSSKNSTPMLRKSSTILTRDEPATLQTPVLLEEVMSIEHNPLIESGQQMESEPALQDRYTSSKTRNQQVQRPLPQRTVLEPSFHGTIHDRDDIVAPSSTLYSTTKHQQRTLSTPQLPQTQTPPMKRTIPDYEQPASIGQQHTFMEQAAPQVQVRPCSASVQQSRPYISRPLYHFHEPSASVKKNENTKRRTAESVTPSYHRIFPTTQITALTKADDVSVPLQRIENRLKEDVSRKDCCICGWLCRGPCSTSYS